MFTVLFWLLCGVAVAEQPGDFAFGCPMGMFRGRLIVE